MLGLFSGNTLADEINKHEVIVRTAGNHIKAAIHETFAKSLAVSYDVLCIFFEGRLKSFLEANSLSGDHVHERTALDSGEECLVELVLGSKFFGRKNDTAARSAECLVSGGCNNVSIRNGRLMCTAGNKTCDMSHINHEDGTHFIGDLTETLEVDGSGISGSACNDELRTALLGNSQYFVIIDVTVFVNTVRYAIEIGTGEVDRAAVRKMTAVCKTHTHESITGLKKSKEYGHICLSTGMRLNICPSAAVELLDPFESKILCEIDKFTTAVVTFARIALGIFIGKMTSHSCHNSFAYEVLGCYEFNVISLTLKLESHGICKFGIDLNYFIKIKHDWFLRLEFLIYFITVVKKMRAKIK